MCNLACETCPSAETRDFISNSCLVFALFSLARLVVTLHTARSMTHTHHHLTPLSRLPLRHPYPGRGCLGARVVTCSQSPPPAAIIV